MSFWPRKSKISKWSKIGPNGPHIAPAGHLERNCGILNFRAIPPLPALPLNDLVIIVPGGRKWSKMDRKLGEKGYFAPKAKGNCPQACLFSAKR